MDQHADTLREDGLVAALVEGVDRAGDGPAARAAFRDGFARLRSTALPEPRTPSIWLSG